MVNIYIVYEIVKITASVVIQHLENCLFGAVSLTKNADTDKYKYSGYHTGFGRQDEFSFGKGLERNCIILGANMSSSSHANKKTK